MAVLAHPPSDGARGPSSGEANAGTCVCVCVCVAERECVKSRERIGQGQVVQKGLKNVVYRADMGDISLR